MDFDCYVLADFDGFLAKPFDPAQVLSLVARLTGARAE